MYEQLAKCERCGQRPLCFSDCKRGYYHRTIYCGCGMRGEAYTADPRRVQLQPPVQLPPARFPGQARRNAKAMGEFIRRSLAALNVEGHSGSLPADAMAAKHPALWEFLTDGGPDPATGEVRETATVLLFRDQEVLKACISDRETGRQLFVSAAGLSTIFGALESALTSESPDWRMKGGGARGRKSQK